MPGPCTFCYLLGRAAHLDVGARAVERLITSASTAAAATTAATGVVVTVITRPPAGTTWSHEKSALVCCTLKRAHNNIRKSRTNPSEVSNPHADAIGPGASMSLLDCFGETFSAAGVREKDRNEGNAAFQAVF